MSILLLGTETQQATAFAPAAGTQAQQQLECVAEGFLEEIHVFAPPTAYTGTPWVGLFADNAGSPGTLLGKGKATGIPGTSAWYAVKLESPVKLAKGTKYWIGGVATVGSFRTVGLTGGSSTTLKESTKSTYTEPTESTEWIGKAKGPISIYGTGSSSGQVGAIADSVKTNSTMVVATDRAAGVITDSNKTNSVVAVTGPINVADKVATNSSMSVATKRATGIVSDSTTVAGHVQMQVYGLSQVYAYGEPSIWRVVQPYKAATPGSPVIIYLHESSADEPGSAEAANVLPKPGETLAAIKPEGQGGNGKQLSTTTYAEHAQENGFCCFVPAYHPLSEGQTGNADLETLITWAKQHAEAWNGDPSKVCIIGGSFGATIGLYEALKLNNEKPGYIKAAAGLSGPVDIPLRIQGRAEEVIATEKWEAEHPGFTGAQLKAWEEENRIDNTNKVVEKLGKYMGMNATQLAHLKESGWLKGPSAEQKAFLKVAEELSPYYDLATMFATMPYLWYAISGNDQTPTAQGEAMSAAAAEHGQPGKYHFNASIPASHGYGYYSSVRSEIYSYFRQALTPAVAASVSDSSQMHSSITLQTNRSVAIIKSSYTAHSEVQTRTTRLIPNVADSVSSRSVVIGPGNHPVDSVAATGHYSISTLRTVSGFASSYTARGLAEARVHREVPLMSDSNTMRSIVKVSVARAIPLVSDSIATRSRVFTGGAVVSRYSMHSSMTNVHGRMTLTNVFAVVAEPIELGVVIT